MKTGYIKLYRSLLDWRWFGDEKMLKLFIYLLLTANLEDKEWEGITVPRGSLVTSYSHLAAACGFTQKQIRGMLDKLIRTNEVAKHSTSKYTVISVLNFNKYQGEGQSAGQTKGKHSGFQRANDGQTKGNNIRNKEYIETEEERSARIRAMVSPSAMLPGETPEEAWERIKRLAE